MLIVMVLLGGYTYKTFFIIYATVFRNVRSKLTHIPLFTQYIVSILTHTHVTYYVEPFSNISRALHTYTLYYNNRCNVLFLDFRITILQILRRTRMLVKKNISYNINRLTRNDWQFK